MHSHCTLFVMEVEGRREEGDIKGGGGGGFATIILAERTSFPAPLQKEKRKGEIAFLTSLVTSFDDPDVDMRSQVRLICDNHS